MPSRAKWSDGRWTARLTTRLPLLALQRAIALRQPAAGLVHHSDRGVQYASEQYTRMLQYHGILPSMSRPGNPYDNAFCESFIKTLKREEIYANEYNTSMSWAPIWKSSSTITTTGSGSTRHWDTKRRRSSKPPHAPQTASTEPTMSFPRHGEIYRSWKRRGRPRKGSGEPVSADSPAHPIDESPVGYSLTGWSPPEPVSASPTATSLTQNATK